MVTCSYKPSFTRKRTCVTEILAQPKRLNQKPSTKKKGVSAPAGSYSPVLQKFYFAQSPKKRCSLVSSQQGMPIPSCCSCLKKAAKASRYSCSTYHTTTSSRSCARTAADFDFLLKVKTSQTVQTLKKHFRSSLNVKPLVLMVFNGFDTVRPPMAFNGFQ